MTPVKTRTLRDRLAPLYDWQAPLERRAIDAALELANPQSGEVVLDVATGTGAVLRALAQRKPRPAAAIGIDRSQAMLERVRQLPTGWRLDRGDATSLPFPGERFDVVIASFVLHLLDQASLERALHEIRRVLRTGGRAVTVTPVAPRSLLRRPYELIVAALAPLSRSSLGLRPLDPRGDLARFGLIPVGARYIHRGYPSLCVLACKPGDAPA